MPKSGLSSKSTRSRLSRRDAIDIGMRRAYLVRGPTIFAWITSWLGGSEILIRECRSIGHHDDIHTEIRTLMARVAAICELLVGNIVLFDAGPLDGLRKHSHRPFRDRNHVGNGILPPYGP